MSDSQNEDKKSFFHTGFMPVTPRVNFSELEEEVLTYWKDNKIFEKSIESRPQEKRWTFLDGPPFVTGMPHYGSLLSSLPKDVFGRYYTMKGYRVQRVWGWDGHGLPIENKVENKLDITSKKDIEATVGVKRFIEECKKYVEDISGEWEWYVDHIGRWADFKNAYKTWNTDYMESVMWVFKQMYEKGHIYKGLRVTLYCPHCSTPISNFEVAMDADNYKETQDHGTTYKYELRADLTAGKAGVKKKSEEQPKTYILAWSTTPWNKIVTPALAVNPNLTYIKVKQNNEFYILAKSAVETLVGEYTIVDELTGLDLIGLEFVPHYDYYVKQVDRGKKLFEIIGGDFVMAEEGTGVVTIAAYGEEDLVVMKKENVHIEIHLDEEGVVKEDVPLFGGMYYLKANKFVNEDLEKRGLVYKDEKITHKVPLCWRCHTRLYYAPIHAWYVNVQDLKDRMKKTNEAVNWFPKHFKYGRFLKSLEHAPDWNISRNRYWGSPVPVWECECGGRFVPGSITELEERSGQKITDLHKPEIDEITIKCESCGKNASRVPEVLDSWIEAGSASFAERHFPFAFLNENEIPDQVRDDQILKEELGRFFPPDFITEYTGQIRAWFYVLHVIGAALYDSPAFKNVSVTGVILGSDGRKMSKNLGNYPDPKEMLTLYGGDALRLYLMGSPVMHGEDILISEEQYRQQVRGMLLILWNVYNFFLTYANLDAWHPGSQKSRPEDDPPLTEKASSRGRSAFGGKSQNVLDKWILSLLHQLIQDVTDSLEKFDTVTAITKLQRFVTEFSTWYIRRSRDRVGPTADDEGDKQVFYQTIHEVLVTLSKLLAPITPFFAEAIYRNLTDEESVHLTDWPVHESRIMNQELEGKMELARELVQYGHAKRKHEGWGVKDPQMEIEIRPPGNYKSLDEDEDIVKLILEELNTYRLLGANGKFDFQHEEYGKITPNDLKDKGQARRIVRKIQGARKDLGTGMSEKVNVTLESWPSSQEDYIKKHALIASLLKGSEFKVTKA